MTNNASVKRLPNQRWQIYPENRELAEKLGNLTDISPIISQLLINRGIENPEDGKIFLEPES
ncbi:MAG: hypothetical protein ACKPCP_29865, partial [Sphaerospermopsis kisseleviana]